MSQKVGSGRLKTDAVTTASITDSSVTAAKLDGTIPHTLSHTNGNFKTRQYVLHGATTDATETEIFVNGTAESRIAVPANTTVMADCMISCRRTDANNESAGWNLKVVADNFNGTTADAGNVYEIIVHTDDADYLVDARANNIGDGAIDILVTGEASKSISWAAVVNTIEISQ